MSGPWISLRGRFGTEAELASLVLADLAEVFTIQREVPGIHCSGKRLRLDAVLRPRDASSWCDPEPTFGVEFKNVRPGHGTRGFTTWAAQAVDYAHTAWDGSGPLTIFTCPPITEGIARGGIDHNDWLMAHLLGQMSVGELGRTRHGWTLRLCGDNIWSERHGVHRKWSLIPKIGSR
jgi:hypothetical protein